MLLSPWTGVNQTREDGIPVSQAPAPRIRLLSVARYLTDGRTVLIPIVGSGVVKAAREALLSSTVVVAIAVVATSQYRLSVVEATYSSQWVSPSSGTVGWAMVAF